LKTKFFKMVKSELLQWCIELLAIFPGRLGFFLRSIVFSKLLFDCGGGSSWGLGVELRGWANIGIGENFSCDRFCSIYANAGLIRIGNNVSLNSSVIINAELGEKIVISDNCLIGPNVILRSSNHNYEKKGILIKNQGHRPREVILHEDVWVGANSVILPGVVLSRGVVVGAGSVVTKSFPEYAVIAGVPAKLIELRC
jgi:acetyltransferase-like isoleucine patch superfamily enzyme